MHFTNTSREHRLTAGYPKWHFCLVHGERGGVDIEVQSKADYLRLARELQAEGFKTSYYLIDNSPLFTYFAQDDLPEVFRR